MSKILIGIDPGTNTGFAQSRDGRLERVETLSIIHAIDHVRAIAANQKHTVTVYIEDARLRRWFGPSEKATTAKLQGAGSIKRDCSIWEDEMRRCGINFVLVNPKDMKGLTKKTAHEFEKLTKWQGRTNEHNRDAAMLIWGR